MTRFLLMRLAMTVATLFAVSVLVFSVARIQGDPRVLLLADQFGGIDPVQWEAMGKDLGLDKSLVHQYGIFLGKILRGDLGRSVWHAKPVGSIIAERLPATLQLALAGLAFAVVTGLPLGVLAAVKRGTIWDQVARGFALIGQAAPSFWIGILLIFVFGVTINLLPTSRKGDITHFIMPAIAVGWFGAAGLVRLIRSAMIEALDSEFVKFARAKGVMRVWTIWKHALRNALIPPLTFAGLLIAALLTGSIVVETVFAWPGLGLLAASSVYNLDYPLTQGIVLLFTTFYVVAAFAVDVIYARVDPRIRYGS